MKRRDSARFISHTLESDRDNKNEDDSQTNHANLQSIQIAYN